MNSLEKITRIPYANEVYFFQTNNEYNLFEEIKYQFADGDEGVFTLYKRVGDNPPGSLKYAPNWGYTCVRIDGVHNAEFRKMLKKVGNTSLVHRITLTLRKVLFEIPNPIAGELFDQGHIFHKNPKNPTKKDLYWRAEFAKPDSLATPQSLIDLENKYKCGLMTWAVPNAWDYLGIDDERFLSLGNRVALSRFLWDLKF